MTATEQWRPRTSAARSQRDTLGVALIGTRGVPARYGGFETAVEEVGRRLADRGHRVTVYCRPTGLPASARPEQHLGMRLVHLPAMRRKTLETLSHTAACTAHLSLTRGTDVAVLFNSANSPLLPAIKAGGVPVATHVDGLEWRRAKWGPTGRRYYRLAEAMAVRWSDALIADAEGIAQYYREEFDVPTELISYGAAIVPESGSDRLAGLGLRPRGFHLVVARFEPENHIALNIEGYLRSRPALPMVVVGAAPYADAYTAQVHSLAASDPRVRLLGPVWDQELLDQLYGNALTYVHGHSVGGTNPSLLRAIGTGTAVLAYDVVFNREVLAEDGRYYHGAQELAELLAKSEVAVEETRLRGARLQQRAERLYRWDDVADRYERLCRSLAGRRPGRPFRHARRLHAEGWS